MLPGSYYQRKQGALRVLLILSYLSVAAASSAAARHPSKLAAAGGSPLVSSQFGQDPLHPQDPLATPEMTPKQKKDLLKHNFDKLRRDADDLAGLAKSLQEELDKSNQHVLSLKVVSRAEKIEKLAKKIKETAKGY